MKVEDLKIEDGQVLGIVKTNTVGSECEFFVCSVQEYNAMNEDQRNKALVQAMWESGYVDVYFAPNKDNP